MNRPWRMAGVIAIGLVAVAVAGDLVHGVFGRTPSVDFSGKDLTGKEWKLSDHRGYGPVILSFFATWCAPCNEEVPHLEEMQRKYADRGLKVVVLTEESPETILNFKRLAGTPVTIIPNASDVFKAYNIEGIPRLIYVDAEGRSAKDVEGFDPAALRDIAKQIEAMPVVPLPESQPASGRSGKKEL